jgi:hypothetical protein
MPKKKADVEPRVYLRKMGTLQTFAWTPVLAAMRDMQPITEATFKRLCKQREDSQREAVAKRAQHVREEALEQAREHLRVFQEQAGEAHALAEESAKALQGVETVAALAKPLEDMTLKELKMKAVQLDMNVGPRWKAETIRKKLAVKMEEMEEEE